MGSVEDHILRAAVYEKFKDWQVGTVGKEGPLKFYNEKARHLCWLTGRDRPYQGHGYDNALPMTDNERAICEAIAGPHGYAYYRALLARRS